MKTKDEILDIAVDIEKRNLAKYRGLTGVYFLISKSEIVYAGKTTNLHGRLIQHFGKKEIAFDSFAFIETLDRDKARELEGNYIVNLSPIHNTSLNPDQCGIPLNNSIDPLNEAFDSLLHNWGNQSIEFISKYRSYKSKYLKSLKDKKAEKIGEGKIKEMLLEAKCVIKISVEIPKTWNN